ncbi:AtpZ/AtpI family protein [Patescibacteria group bacterium]
MIEKRKDTDSFDWSALRLALRLGYTIAIPLVLLALAGRIIDNKYDTSPVFLLIGIGLSIFVSTLAVYKVTVPILQGFSKEKSNNERNE